MQDKEQRIGQTMADAVATLPEEKKQYFVGFAEGVAAMAALGDQSKKAAPNKGL